jgi:cell division protein FtsW
MTLIYLQPATSIIALFMVAIGAMCYVTKISSKIIFILATGLIIVVGLMIVFGGNYRRDRITNEDDYQRRQSIIGIVRGGVMGVGFGQSRQKYNFLPKSYTDSIYAVIAEEFGFVGTMIILTIYFSIFFLGFYVAVHISDPFAALFVVGTTT